MTRSSRLVAATRVHQNQASRPIDLDAVSAFFTSALAYSDLVLMAVGTGDASAADAAATIAAVQERGRQAEAAATPPRTGAVRVLHVTPWGQFTPALNALLCAAASDGFPLVLFQSLETVVTAKVVGALVGELEPDRDLVVGGALPGHDWSPGEHELTGTTTPWNTLALWNVPKLARLGFVTVSDGAVAGVAGGVEEVAVIALLQQLAAARHHRPHHHQHSGGGTDMRAKLARLDAVTWDAEWADDARRRWHADKMASKRDRAAAQAAVLGVTPGRVLHVDLTTAPTEEQHIGGVGSGSGDGGSAGGATA